MESNLETIKELNQKIAEGSLSNYREYTRKTRKRDISEIFEFLYNQFGVKYILDYTFDETESFKQWIQSKQVGLDRKKRIFLSFKNMVNHALKEHAAKGNLQLVSYWKFIIDNVQFTEAGTKREISLIEKKQIITFLADLKKNRLEDYFLFGILIYSGCRIGGLISLIYNNIDFEKGIFFTQEKATKKSSGWNRYFLPMKFCKELFLYCQQENIKGNDKICKITDKQIRKRLKSYGVSWHPHLFRHTFRTQLHLMGCPDIEAEFLLNHAVKSITQVYLQQLNSQKHLREIYDKYFPY